MKDSNAAAISGNVDVTDASVRRRSLIAACTAHAIHDGLTDLIYVLLPIWQTQFSISYALVGLLRGSYSGTMAAFQLLASRMAKRWGRERMLVGGTSLAGVAYLIAGQAGHGGADDCAGAGRAGRQHTTSAGVVAGHRCAPGWRWRQRGAVAIQLCRRHRQDADSGAGRSVSRHHELADQRDLDRIAGSGGGRFAMVVDPRAG